MKVLVDECAPRALKSFLISQGYDSLTVQEAGWSGKSNGELLKLAQTQFDVLITVDAGLSYQQNLSGRPIAVLVLLGRSNRVKDLRQHFSACVGALKTIKPGEILRVGSTP